MMVLGIVLIVLAVLFGLGVSVSSGESATMSVFGVDFGVIVPTVFFLGAAAGAALMVGLWLTKKGLARGYRRHKEVKELRQQVSAAPATDTDRDTGRDLSTDPRTGDEVDTTPEHSTGKHAATEVDDGDSRTVDLQAGDRLATDRPAGERLADDRHTVADGTDHKQPH
ncbi:hypothetical protein GCM10009789_51750 [Kribbella sancticallisti]|uniref:Lipopolysaccharide assembly protein A domain-containing protein n=1 Tax=Kribbella sancticallisti TaxID=460087 RepID=A0ABP4PWK0_9ACTN